jgi:hypothetical protein
MLRAMAPPCETGILVAILECGEDVVRHLQRLERRSRPLEYSEAWRWGDWPGSGPDLAILVTKEGDIPWLGRVEAAARAVTSRDRKIDVEQVRVITLEQLRERLPEAHRGSVHMRGLLPREAGDAVVAALYALLPTYHALIDRLGQPRAEFPSQGPQAELLLQP